MKQPHTRCILLRVIEQISDMMILSVLWMIGCLPIVTIVASTKSLIYACGKKIDGQSAHIIQDFFISYKQNMLKSIILMIFEVVIWSFGLTYLIVGYASLTKVCSLLTVLMGLVTFELVMITGYLCALFGRFSFNVFTLIKKTFLIIHFYILDSILAFLVIMGLTIILVKIPTLILLIPTMMALTICYFIKKTMLRYMEQNEIKKLIAKNL